MPEQQIQEDNSLDNTQDVNADVQANTGDQAESPNELKKSQKIAAGALAFFAFLIIIIWILQFRNSVDAPFRPNISQPQTVDNTCPGGLCGNDTTVNLENIDTDKDGLSDTDELNYYNTSPYIEDSDSDGLLDGEEINMDEDPLCPLGQNCRAPAVNPSGESGQESGGEETSSSDSDFTNTGTDDLSAAEIRALLIDNGMNKEILGQISDEELIRSFKETIGSMQ